MRYDNYPYTKPIEVKRRHQGRVETRRLRVQLVGQAVASGP